MGRKNYVVLPTAGRRMQLFHLIFTEPGVHLLGHPCTPRGGRDGWMDERALCIAHHQDAQKSRDEPSLGSTCELKYYHAEE